MRIRNISFAAALLAFAADAADPVPSVPPVPKGTVVRMEGKGIEDGWHEGRISVTGAGCTMVTLQKPTKDGYTMIALVATARLQQQVPAGWSDLPLARLLAREPKHYLEGSD